MSTYPIDPQTLSIGLLVVRVVFGLIMAAHGASKLLGWFGGHGLRGTGEFFVQLGFTPGPAFAAAASLSEIISGILVAVGFLGPIGPALMVSVMIVAILTVKLKNVSGLDDFAELDEPLYALSFVWLFFSGAGWLSIDGFIKPVISSRLQQNKSKSSAEAPNDEASLVEDPHLLSEHDSH